MFVKILITAILIVLVFVRIVRGQDAISTIVTGYSSPFGIILTTDGIIYFAEYGNNCIRKVQSGTVSVVAGVVSATGASSSDGTPATSAYLNGPPALFVTTSGVIYFTEYSGHQVRKITTSGTLATVAGTANTATFTGDGGPAVSATLSNPWGIWIDSSPGNIFITDAGNNKIRMINSAGIISSFAGTGTGSYSGDGGSALSATLYFPTGIWGDSSGLYIYFNDRYNYRVRRVTRSSGIINLFAGMGSSISTTPNDGGPATSAYFVQVSGVTLDTIGNVYLCDYSGHRIRKVDTSGIISTYAGTGTSGSSTDGTFATSALLNQPRMAVVDTSGILYFTDLGNGALKRIYSATPTTSPTYPPTRSPTRPPSIAPTLSPTVPPTLPPTFAPSLSPTFPPTFVPTISPTQSPTVSPTQVPTYSPTFSPSGQPTMQPSGQPSGQPTGQPSNQPTTQPSLQPIGRPSGQPTLQPSGQPTSQPTIQPSNHPTIQPSVHPTAQPFAQPSGQPSCQPTGQPSASPTRSPSSQPSCQPTVQPTVLPSKQPSCQPSRSPSSQPTYNPTAHPTRQPSGQPTVQPSCHPTRVPTAQPSSIPSSAPSNQPLSQPSTQPSVQPSGLPSGVPSTLPTNQPTNNPSSQPSCEPSGRPSSQPSSQPSRSPSTQPSTTPSAVPSSLPSIQPSSSPTIQPSGVPTIVPSTQPSTIPTCQPTCQPSSSPTMQPSRQPTTQPSASPTTQPSISPTIQPSAQPTRIPTSQPSSSPSTQPSGSPTNQPTNLPTSQPTNTPTIQPSLIPTGQPSGVPSIQPSSRPSSQPSNSPSNQPSSAPTVQPTSRPSVEPSRSPTAQPSDQPISHPSRQPTTQPSSSPTRSPSTQPSVQPTASPTTQPSCVPTSAPTKMISTRLCFSPPLMDPELISMDPSSAVIFMTHPKCLDLVVEVNIPLSSCGQAWSYYSVELLCDDASVDVCSSQQEYLLSLTSPDDLIIFRGEFLRSLIEDDLVIQVTICNYLNYCARQRIEVTLDGTTLFAPVVALADSVYRVIKRTQSLSLLSTFYVPECGGFQRTKAVKATWTCYDTSKEDVANACVSVSSDPSKFVVAQNSLNSGTTYNITFTALDTVTSRHTSETVVVKVEEIPLQIIVTPMGSQILRVGESLELDGSSSYDPNISHSNLAGSATLEFEWTCKSVNETDCTLLIQQDRSSKVIVSTTEATEVGNIYNIDVTARNEVSGRVATKSIEIVIVSPNDPKIAFTILESSLTDVDVNKQFSIPAMVQTPTDCTAGWTASKIVSTSEEIYYEEAIVNLQSLSLVPIQKIFLGSLLMDSVNLVLTASALEVGSKYSFVLQCGSSSNHVVLTTNAPPSDGILSLSPNWGVELSTIFYWYGKDWRDSDLPISYEFGFISPTTGTFLPIRDRAAIRRTQSKLPAGLFANEFVVQTMIRVYDSLDASTEKQLSVVVTELDRSDLAKAINSSLVLLSTQSKDEPLSSEQIQSMVIVAGSSLTKINCTLSPDCNSLNRESCGTLQDHICGNCLMGYFGNSGPSNLLCSDINSLKIAWSNCTINEDCGSTLYQCNEKTKLCEIKDQKSCSNSCHSHGHCVFRNKITQDVIEKCPLYSATCEAVCVCHTGYGGDSCDQSTVVAEANQQTRNQLLRSIDLVPLASMEEGDDAVTTSSLNRASILRSLLNVDASLSSLSIASNMTEELMSNLLSVDANEVVIDDLEDVVDVVDTLVSGTEHGSFTLLEGLGDVAIRSHVIGANSSVIMSDSFRMITTSIGSNVSIVNVPLTEVETVTGLLNTQVVLSSNSSLVSSSLNLIQTYPSLWSINDVDGNNISYLSNAVSIRLSATESFYHQMRVKLPLMVNQSEAGSMLSLLDKGVVVFSTNCSRKDYTIESFICPGSNVTLINRCHGEVGQIISHCPLLQPTCHVPHVTNSEVNCSMVDIDMDYMICDCTFIALPSKRRRLASDSLVVNGATLLGITAYVGQDFANTFVASKTLSDIQSADQVMVVLSLFISVWVLGGVLIGYMHWTKNYSHRKKVKAVKGLKELFRHAGVAQELDAEIGAYSPEAAVRLLSNYLATIIPRAFSNKSILARMKEELMRHHPYLRLFNVKQSDRSPMLTTIQMVTVQSLMMFVLAMLYDLQCPDDDGTCREHLDKVSCLKRKSLFDSTQTYCNWNEEAITGTCEYADPVFSLAVGIYCAVLISVVTATINWPIDYLFTILSAPIKDTLQAQIAAAQMVARARRASVSSLTGPTVVNSGRRRAAAFAAAPTPSIPPASLSSTQTKQASGVESGKNCHKKKKVKTVNGMHNASSRLEVKFIPEQIIDAHDVAKSALRQQIQEIVVNNKAEHISTEGVLDIVYAYRERLLSREKELGMEAGQQISEWIDKFTEQWGISAITGRIYEFNVPRHKNPYWAQGDTVMDLISNSLTIVEDIANEEAQFLRQVPESHAGLELIQLFIQDLLGQDTVAARIFSAKVNEDYKSFPAVSRGGKIIAAVCVVAVNLLFAYYTMLKGYVKGRAWQRSFLVACLVQFVVEILLFTTVECLYFNCFVPSLVTNEMHKIQRVLRETIHSIAFSGSNSFSNDVLMDGKKLSLNAPNHFFVSTKVAKCFPTMLESVLILSYRSVLPGEISQKWKSAYHWNTAFEAKYNAESDIKIRPHNDSGLLRLDHSHASNRSWAGFIQWSIMTFFMTLTMMLASVVAFIPFSVQRAVIRFVQPFMLGGLALAWMFIVASSIYLSLFSVVVSLIVLFLIGQHCFYRYHRSFNKRSDAIRGVITPLALSTVKLDADDSYSSSEDGKDDNGKHDHRALHEREQLHRESQPQKPSREIIGETKIDLSKNAKVLLSNIYEISGSYSSSSLQLISDDETTKKLSKQSLSNASPQGSKSDTISKSYGDGSQKALTPSERSFDNKNVEQNEKDSQSSSSVSCSESSESDSSDEDHHRRDHHRSSKR